MENILKPVEDLRSSARYYTHHLPVNIISKDAFDIPARLNNVSLGGLQLLCSKYASKHLSKLMHPIDSLNEELKNIVAEIMDKDNSIIFKLSCKLVYICNNHLPDDYCSDAVGLEVLIDDPENKWALQRCYEMIPKSTTELLNPITTL